MCVCVLVNLIWIKECCARKYAHTKRGRKEREKGEKERTGGERERREREDGRRERKERKRKTRTCMDEERKGFDLVSSAAVWVVVRFSMTCSCACLSCTLCECGCG